MTNKSNLWDSALSDPIPSGTVTLPTTTWGGYTPTSVPIYTTQSVPTFSVGTNTSNPLPWNINIHDGKAIMSEDGEVQLNGEKADLVINGKSLKDTLKGIEDRLGILSVNPKLEAEFAELKELSQKYKELESKLLAQMKVFAILKDDK
jgi:hypothetical protein